jgi:hypothetical protein
VLQRILNDQPPTWLEHPGAFTQGAAPHLRRQFMKQKNAGNGILDAIREGNRLSFTDNKSGA